MVCDVICASADPVLSRRVFGPRVAGTFHSGCGEGPLGQLGSAIGTSSFTGP